MDLFAAVALSMLPASRSRVASTFKEIRHQPNLALNDMLEAVLRACDVPEVEWGEAVRVARDARAKRSAPPGRRQ